MIKWVLLYFLIGFLISLFIIKFSNGDKVLSKLPGTFTVLMMFGYTMTWPFTVLYWISKFLMTLTFKLVISYKFWLLVIIFLIALGIVKCNTSKAACYILEDEYTGSFNYSDYKQITTKSHGFKSYTRYTALTKKSSKQYKLQHGYAYTGQYGIRMVNGRYCIAVGTGVCKKVGQYIDVILENGTWIPCIMADQKADQHTDKKYHITTVHNKCVCEFYLDEVPKRIKDCGDVSKACPEWQSPVCEFRVYPVNVFEEEEE